MKIYGIEIKQEVVSAVVEMMRTVGPVKGKMFTASRKPVAAAQP